MIFRFTLPQTLTAGLEPATFRLTAGRSTIELPGNNGIKEDRTLDLLLAEQALSQLSYNPIVGITGFEPAASRSQAAPSTKLAYIPIC